MIAESLAGYRAVADAYAPLVDEPWPRRDIQQEGTCDGCAERLPLVAAYDDPAGESEPWLCERCAAEIDFHAAFDPSTVLALVAAVEAVEEALAREEPTISRYAIAGVIAAAVRGALDAALAPLDGTP